MGTKEGLVTLEVGKVDKSDETLGNLVVYPNPFRPNGTNDVKIENEDGTPLPPGECYIFDISGQIVRTLKDDQPFGYKWDGTNADGKKCASGVYFYLIKTNTNNTARGKIVMIR